MKIRIDDIQTPCSVCTNHFNHEFDGNTSDCESCDYNIVVQLLKYVVKYKFDCKFCRNCIDKGFGFLYCEFGEDYRKKCEKENLIDLDYNALVNALGVEVSSN